MSSCVTGMVLTSWPYTAPYHKTIQWYPPLGYELEARCPPCKRILSSDSCAISLASKEKWMRQPLCDTVSKLYCAIGGGGAWIGPGCQCQHTVFLFSGINFRRSQSQLHFLSLAELILEKCCSSWGKPSDYNCISESQEELSFAKITLPITIFTLSGV